jgi:hypothetical protein
MTTHRSSTWLRRWALNAILFLCALPLAHAAPLVAPNAYFWGGSDGWVSGGAGGRLQQMHHKSQFWPANETHAITGMAWRPGKANAVENVNWTISYIEVWVSTVNVDVGDLSPIFAANYAAATNRTRVYAGPITFAYNITSYNVTHGFDQVIPFQVPFSYTPADGHLLVDFISSDDAHHIWTRQVDIPATTDPTTSCIWGAHQYPSGNANVWGLGVVTQFQTDYAWVPPQPANVSLLSVTINPTTVKGGENGSGTVRLDAPAPVGGVDVALAWDTSAATSPALIHLSTGQVEGPFSYYTQFANATTPATLTATLSGASRSAALTIKATLPPVGVGEPGLWDVEKVPNTPDQLYGAWSSIAMFNNEPWIAYQDSTGVGTVKLAHKTGGQWIVETVDGNPALPEQALFAAGPISLKLDHLGQPNVAYYSSEGLRWAKKTGSTWTYNKVDASTEPIGISMVLDADDHAHIAFFDAGGGTEYGLYYVHWNGSGWDQNHFQVSGSVWNNGYKGTGSALALDSAGIPSIAFSDPGATGQLSITKLDGPPDFSDAKWVASNVTGAMYSGYASLAIDTANHPHVVYQRAQTGANTVLQYAWFDGTSWTVTTADDGGTAQHGVGANTALVLDPQQLPRVSYWDAIFNTVKYAHFDGANWLTHLVDPTTPVGLYSTSLALDSWGAPHFSYYEQHTLPGGALRGSLRYATLAKPQIRLTPQPGSLIELTWPGEPQGFTLESSVTLASGSWQPWNGTLSESAGIKKVTIGTSGEPSRFFLLKR